MKKHIPCSLSEVKEAILSLGEVLSEAEAVGIMGSLARGDFNERSDIDVFVVVKERRSDYDVDRTWWEKMHDVLSKFRRDITVIVYSIEGLKKILNWYVLRLASEGIIVYDKGGIKLLFNKIIETARNAGLVEREVGTHRVWSAKNLRLGEEFVLEVKE